MHGELVCTYLDGDGSVHYINYPPDKAWGWKKLSCLAAAPESQSDCVRGKEVYDDNTHTCVPFKKPDPVSFPLST